MRRTSLNANAQIGVNHADITRVCEYSYSRCTKPALERWPQTDIVLAQAAIVAALDHKRQTNANDLNKQFALLCKCQKRSVAER